MNLLKLLDECARLGVRLRAENGRLHMRAPAGAMTADLQEALREHKAALLERLQQRSNGPASSGAVQRRELHPGEDLPLSLVQQSLWFLNRMEPDSLPAYNVRKAFKLQGELDLACWQAAFQALVDRHEALRTYFVAQDERPLARVADGLAAAMEITDLSALPPKQREEELRRRIDEEGLYNFDLENAPLFRAQLFRTSPDGLLFLMNAHHLIADAWSAGLMLRDLFKGYQNLLSGHPAFDDEPPYQYSDFVFWQREQVESGAYNAPLAYWTRQLAKLPALKLPVDYPRPEQSIYTGASVDFVLPAGVAAMLRRYSAEAGVTLYTVLLASYAALLRRFSGQADFPIGTSIAGRSSRPEWSGVVGFFASLLVLRMELDDDPSFADWVMRVEQVKLDGFSHQEVPFDLVVKAVRPQRNLGQNPLFQVLFLYLQGSDGTVAAPGLVMSEAPTPEVCSMFDMRLFVQDLGDELRGELTYKSALFRAETVSRLLSAWLELLAAALDDPSRRITELPMLSRLEQQELLQGRNAIQPFALRRQTLAGEFAAQAASFPDRVAVSFGDEHLSYRALDRRANRLARALRERGVGPESRVGLLLPRGLELVVGILAVLKAGGAYVPMDPADPPARLAYIIEDSRPAALISDPGVELPPVPEGVSRVCLDGDQSWVDGLSDAPLAELAGAANAAYVIYTSGSTGQPRGVIVPHANALRLMHATQPWYGFNEHDVWTLFHSYAFDFSVWELWGALLYGGRLVVVPHLTSRSPDAFFRLLAEEGVTVLNQTPSAFRSLVAYEPPEDLPGLALRYVIFGGEALEPAMLKPWFERHGDQQPKLVNMYGITETTVHVTYRPVTRAQSDSRSLIGERIPDLGLYILDAHLEPVPEGIIGELYVSGAGLARGYLNRPGLTADRFIANPFSAKGGERLYRTGDLACWRPGPDIEFLGRGDHQVKIRGFRIELGEIESVLLGCAGVKEAVVLVREDRPGQRRLAAYYVPASEQSVDPAGLRSVCQARLPGHMVPSGYVPVDAWPLTRNGKLDRDALPAPDTDTDLAHPAFAPPQTPMEKLLADSWRQVLKVKQVGVDDDFFALGGDSILMLEVLSYLSRQGVSGTVAQLYQYPRLDALAGVLANQGDASAESPGIAPFALVREGDRAKLPPGLVDAYPLSQLQAGMFFESQLNSGRAIYHDIFSFHLRLPLREPAWLNALQALVERHPVLRTGFDFTHYEEPLQLVYPSVPVKCGFADIGALSDAEQVQRLKAIIDAEREQPFDPDDPPLLRFHLVRRSGDTSQIVFGFHHAILDGWSVALMMTQLVRGYIAELNRMEAANEPPPTVRYADFIALEQAAMAAAGEQDYWQKAASQLPQTRLPRQDDAPVGATRIALRTMALDEPTCAGLRRIGQLTGAPLKTVALAAHLRVVGLLAGQDEVVTGLVANGRPEGGGGERVLGLFLNTLPLRFTLGAGDFVDLVRQVFDAEREVLAHRRFPMHRIKALSGAAALFDTAFNFVHFHVYEEILNASGIEVLGHQVWEETDFPFLCQFSVYPGSPRLDLTLVYDASQFSAEQIDTIAGYYRRCLEAMANAPHAEVSRHSLLSADERHRLLAEWPGGSASFAAGLTLDGWFRRQAAKTPHRAAVSFQGETLTYAELDRRSDRLAGRLAALGAGAGARVGLCAARGPGLVAGVLGILKAGAAYVPLDPAYPARRLAFMAEDAGLAAVVADRAQGALLDAACPSAARLLLDEAGGEPGPAPAPGASPADPAYIIYTSGSTGQPKGVVVTHANAARLMLATEPLFGFNEHDVWTLFHSYAFDFSVWEIWGALLYGGRLVVVPADAREPVAFRKLLADERVTVLNQTPSAFYPLAEEDAGRDPGELALRYIVFGGEALDPARLDGWFRRHGDDRPQLVNMYGITETTVHVTHRRLRRADALARRGSLIGRPLPDLSVRVLDPAMRPVPEGVAGEMWVGGAGVAQGYLNRPELTAERFVADPWGAGKLYRSGDLARWRAGGELEYLGRIDGQVKVRGFRIELGEIEQALREAGLREAAVLARPGPGGTPRLVAYGVVRDGADATARSLRQACEARLPDYMVPSAYVLLPALPLTANGKLDRAALPEPDLGLHAVHAAYVAPRNEMETQLCAMWEQVLGVAQVGVQHNFFELGGHSLTATQLVSRVRERFAVQLPLRSLFDDPTVENLASMIMSLQTQDAKPQAGIASMKRGRRQVSLSASGEVQVLTKDLSRQP